MSDPDRLADWLLSTEGRVARIVAGTVLILLGLGAIGGFLGVLLLLVGAVPIASAAYGTLLVGPLLGRDIRGRRPEDQPEEEKDEDEDSDDEDEDDEPRSEEKDEDRSEENEGEPRSEEKDEDRSEENEGEPRSEEKDEDRSEPDDDAPARKPDPDWSAPPLARAERAAGQGPRTKDLRAEDEPPES